MHPTVEFGAPCKRAPGICWVSMGRRVASITMASTLVTGRKRMPTCPSRVLTDQKSTSCLALVISFANDDGFSSRFLFKLLMEALNAIYDITEDVLERCLDEISSIDLFGYLWLAS